MGFLYGFFPWVCWFLVFLEPSFAFEGKCCVIVLVRLPKQILEEAEGGWVVSSFKVVLWCLGVLPVSVQKRVQILERHVLAVAQKGCLNKEV